MKKQKLVIVCGANISVQEINEFRKQIVNVDTYDIVIRKIEKTPQKKEYKHKKWESPYKYHK